MADLSDHKARRYGDQYQCSVCGCAWDIGDVDMPACVPPPPIVKSTKAPLEKDVEAKLVRDVKRIGGVSWKFVSPNNRGVSDRIVLYHGRTIYVELKRDGGKMSPLQEQFRLKVLNNGGEFAEVVGIAGVNAFIEKLKNEQSVWASYLGALRGIVVWFKGRKF